MSEILFRRPDVNDASSIWSFIKDNKPLDENSCYLYALLCHHFSDTCAIAEIDSKLVGVLTGFVPPKNPEVFFLWQVAVNNQFRNRGIAQKLLSCAIEQSDSKIRYVEATVTRSNKKSMKFLTNFAQNYGASILTSPLFSSKVLGGDHEPEEMVRIGPLPKISEVIV